uniref:Scaffolding anchor of CK1 domain-containing protein n=1 Tax=Eptatretus burgeri TaxID=7764 RepID=A0A8C4QU81_EPTBU
MALSQEMCLADRNINWIASDSKPEFFYSEVQRLALEALMDSGLDAYQELLEKENIRNFLSKDELEKVRLGVRSMWTGGKSAGGSKEESDAEESGDKTSQSTLTYWPERSDDEDPSTLDLGWTDCESYRGVTRATVYTQPPAEGAASIKETVRRIVQHAQSLIAIVMDHFTDIDIFKDILDGIKRRKLAVYIIHDESSISRFLNMCQVVGMHQGQEKRMRVRSLAGTCLRTHSGKEVEGFMRQKFMIVDGDKAVTGTYSFTWTSSRLDRNIITVLTGQIVDTFDQEFRSLYELSKPVHLDSLGLPPDPQPRKSEELPSKASVSSEVSRRLLNPKYALVSKQQQCQSSSKNAPLVKRPKSPGHTTPSPTTKDFSAIDMWVCKAAAPQKETDSIIEMIIIPECLEPYDTPVKRNDSLPKLIGVKAQPATSRDERDSKELQPAKAKREHSSQGKLQTVSPIKDANKTTARQQSFQWQQSPANPESRGRCGEHGNKERTQQSRQSKTNPSKEGQVFFERNNLSTEKWAKSTEDLEQPMHSAKGRQRKDSSSNLNLASRESDGCKPQSCSPKRQASPASKRNPRTRLISDSSEGCTSQQSQCHSTKSNSPKRQESAASKQNPRTEFISGSSEGRTSQQSRCDSTEGAQKPCSLRKQGNITMVNGPASHEQEERNKEIGDEATATATVLPAEGECSNEREFENDGATSAINCNHIEGIGEFEPEMVGLGHSSSDGEAKISTLTMGAVATLEEDCVSGDDTPMASVHVIIHNSEASKPQSNSTGTDKLSFHSASGSYEPKTEKEVRPKRMSYTCNTS